MSSAKSTTAGVSLEPCSPSSARPWATWAAGVAARAASPRWLRRPSGVTWRHGRSSGIAWCSCASAKWCCGISRRTCWSKPRAATGRPPLSSNWPWPNSSRSPRWSQSKRRACTPSPGPAMTRTAGAGRTNSSARSRPPLAAAPIRLCATSSPSGCSGCRATLKATSCRAILATPGRLRRPLRGRAQERLVATEHPPAPLPPGSQAQVLSGLRVVEVGQYVAAPLAGTIFADLGADVVKVERPGGDPMRADPARFAAWNRGKESVELNLRTRQGADTLGDLVDEADLLIENLRPGALDRLGLAPATLRASRPRLVTCSISAWGSDGPSRDDPGWEPLVHARAGAQQGLFTGDDPMWLPFPVASVSAALVAVLGAGAALIKRASTGYGQHVETSLLDALLFLNAAAIFHREGHRPRVVRQTKSPILRVFDTADGRAVMVNLSGTERWRELCRVLGLDDGGLDYATPEGLSRLSDREWNRNMLQRVMEGFASKTADEWETALLAQPAAVAKCNSLAEWLASEQARIDHLVVETDDPVLGRVPLVCPPVRIAVEPGERRPGRRHGGEQGALGGHRVIDLSSFWAGPLASRLLAELGADVVKVEPPGGE